MIGSAADLVLALQTIAVKCEFQRASKTVERGRIAGLDQRCAHQWGHQGKVAEAFALAYAKAGDESSAVDWYTKALQANDGGASVRAAEQRANLQVRLAWNGVNGRHTAAEVLRKQNAPKKKIDEAEKRLAEAIAEGTAQIGTAIAVLEKLVGVEPSMERASLLGSAHKRRALIAAIHEDAATEAAAINEMKQYLRAG